MSPEQREELIKIVWATAELMGSDLSKEAAKMLVSDLSSYQYDQVARALQRCRQEAKRLTLEAVLSRVEDGRPGPERAWAMLPAGEDQSVVWTEEMSRAWGEALPLMDSDQIAARMAFKEAYAELLLEARRSGKPANWFLSPGGDPEGRKQAIRDAVDRGRISSDRAQAMFPEYLEGQVTEAPRLTSDRPERADFAQHFDELRKKLE